MGPPHSSLTLHSVPQVSSARPVDNPPTGDPAQGSSGPGIVSSGRWWQRHSELLQSLQPPPPGTAAVAAARSLASLPASISPAPFCLLQPPWWPDCHGAFHGKKKLLEVLKRRHIITSQSASRGRGTWWQLASSQRQPLHQEGHGSLSYGVAHLTMTSVSFGG